MSTNDELRELAGRLGKRVYYLPSANHDLAQFGLRLPPWAQSATATDGFDLLVCLPLDLDHPLQFRDNRRGRCKECNRRIQYRPTVPKRLPRVCVACALRRVRGDA